MQLTNKNTFLTQYVALSRLEKEIKNLKDKK